MNKVNININLYLDYGTNFKSKENFINHITKSIKNSPVGYAGFRNKSYLKMTLGGGIFDYDKFNKIKELNFNKSKIIKIVKHSINRCNQFLSLDKCHIFVFPCFSSFVKSKMNGVSGYTPWKKSILIYLNPIKNWESKFKETICHEYNHAVIRNYHNWSTILDSLIFEGFAEHFREKVIGGKKAPWAKSLSKKKALLIFNKIKDKLNSKNQALYYDLFFGSKKYPRWTGYSIGYYIVENYLKEQKNMNWNKIIKLKPEEILKESNF